MRRCILFWLTLAAMVFFLLGSLYTSRCRGAAEPQVYRVIDLYFEAVVMEDGALRFSVPTEIDAALLDVLHHRHRPPENRVKQERKESRAREFYERGNQRCRATASSTGRRCRNPALEGSLYCRFHMP